MFNHFPKTLITILTVTVITACGGGGGGGGDTATADDVPLQSEIVGSVSGVSYVSRSYSGTTDANGSFQYEPGEEVSFSIGELPLGTVSSVGEYLSFGDPINIENEVDSYALNLLRLLIALDVDGDPSNGIELIPEVAALANIDLTDETAVIAALYALDSSLQLPTSEEAIAAYDAALFEAMDEFINIASYETVTSYLVPAVAGATNTACQVFTGATFDVSKNSSNQKVYSGTLLYAGNTLESFSFSGSRDGYTSEGTHVKMWNMSDEGGVLSINGEAHLTDQTITGTECRQQIRLKILDGTNKAPVVAVRTVMQGIEGCNIQANLNLLTGGTDSGTPYNVTSYIVASDVDGVLSNVSLTPFNDATAQTTTDLTQTIGVSSTTENAKFSAMCGTSGGLNLLTNYSWDDSVSPVPHLLGCKTVTVPCESGFHSEVSVTDNQGEITIVSSEQSPAPELPSTANYGTYSIAAYTGVFDGSPSNLSQSINTTFLYFFEYGGSACKLWSGEPATSLGSITGADVECFAYDPVSKETVIYVSEVPNDDGYSKYLHPLTLTVSDLGEYMSYTVDGTAQRKYDTDGSTLLGVSTDTIRVKFTGYMAKSSL